MASGTISKSPYRITQAGTYNLGDLIVPVFTSGSGNYFSIFLPVDIADGLTITGMSITTMNLYLGSTAITQGNFGSPLLSSATRTKVGFRVECRFATTQVKNNGGSAAAVDLTITVA